MDSHGLGFRVLTVGRGQGTGVLHFNENQAWPLPGGTTQKLCTPGEASAGVVWGPSVMGQKPLAPINTVINSHG